ncbi:hypothetical protein BDN67DRAFT_913049 [Paxillus ammoniavirescens]|nr:hypothetical protein BDN67DRAFT_913049 [Paxillus ammoniavirescens]
MDAWKQAEKERLERNNSRRTVFREALALWTEESARAKDEGRRPGWVRPKLGKLKTPAPKPVVDGPEGDEAERHVSENDNNGDASDAGSVDEWQRR